jgi:ABC-type enterochelin transport system substrate-binding protein
VTSRTTLWAVAGIALALVLTGCRPEPAVEPTPTFTSEAEAFAAAEATYREYVKALNEVDLSDPETFEGVYAWTTGEANASARTSFTRMAADGWTVTGESRYDNFVGVVFNPLSPEEIVVAEVCLDVALIDVLDEAGVSQVPASRVDRQPARVTFAPAETPTTLAIAVSAATEADTCGS